MCERMKNLEPTFLKKKQKKESSTREQFHGKFASFFTTPNVRDTRQCKTASVHYYAASIITFPLVKHRK